MPFPTDSDSTAAEAAADLAGWVRDTRKQVAARIAAIDATATADVNNLCVWASNRLGMWQPGGGAWIFSQKAAVTGIQAALRAMFPGKWADDAAVTTSLNTAQTGMATALTAVVSNAPKDGNGWLLVSSFVSEVYTPRTLSAGAALTNLRNVLVALQTALAG